MSRVETLGRTLDQPFVQDGALHEVDKNSVARLVRNGLAVVAFSQLEDFIRSRTAEVLREIPSSGVGFGQLPKKVQKSATIGLIRPLQSRAKLLADDTLRLAFLQEHAGYIASTAATPFVLSDLSLGYEGSNLSQEEVSNMLGAFNVKDGWAQISLLASKVGLSGLSLGSVFEAAAKRRHAAAHDAMAATPYGDLKDFLSHARAIAFGFDAMLSLCLMRMRARDAAYLGGSTLGASDVGVVLIEKTRRGFRARDLGRTAPVATGADESAVLTAAVPWALTRQRVCATLDANGRLSRWEIPAA